MLCDTLDVLDTRIIERKFVLPKTLVVIDTEQTLKYEVNAATFNKAVVITTNITEETLEKMMRFLTTRKVWFKLHRLYDWVQWKSTK